MVVQLVQFCKTDTEGYKLCTFYMEKGEMLISYRVVTHDNHTER